MQTRFALIILTILTIGTQAKEVDITVSKGTEQNVISSLAPTPASYDADQNMTLTAVFSVPLDVTSVQKNNVKLKKITQSQESMIDGEVAYDANENAVTFRPRTLLSSGYYEVELKSFKATKADKDQHIKEITYRFYVPEVINGYKLPLEPNKALNDSTLLGIDSNKNGVRDDVEIYIIKRYATDPKYPKTKTAIALQYAWASQKILENPTMESKKYIDDALDCESYWAWKEMKKNTQGQSNFERGLYYSNLSSLIDSNLRDHIYNTRERIEQKFSFNAALSGNIFDGRDESIDNCQINIDNLGE